MKLPNPERARIDSSKLSGYCLNPSHPHGRHKVRVFVAALDMTADDEEELRTALEDAVRTGTASRLAETRHGSLFTVDLTMTRQMHRANLRSVWMVRRGEDFPRLVTCYVKARKGS